MFRLDPVDFSVFWFCTVMIFYGIHSARG